jgi:hypothetical protein
MAQAKLSLSPRRATIMAKEQNTMIKQIIYTLIGVAVFLVVGVGLRLATEQNLSLTQPALNITLPRSWVKVTGENIADGMELQQYSPVKNKAVSIRLYNRGALDGTTEKAQLEALKDWTRHVVNVALPTEIKYDGRTISRTIRTLSGNEQVVVYDRPVLGKTWLFYASATIPISAEAEWKKEVLKALTSVVPK